MEANKENLNTLKVKTRIPLPMEPLPALPKHLLLKKIQKDPVSEDNRIPLKTINSSSGLLAGPSTGHDGVVSTKTRRTYEVDSKYVTFRQRNEDLDWEFKVFKEETNNKDSSIISISDDEESFIEGDKEKYNSISENKQKNCLGEARKVLTPLHRSTLEPKRVRNIKKSLKRPHSRELQGLSPLTHPEKKGEENFKRRLKFNDRLNDRLQSLDIFEKSYTECIERDYVKDLFPHLLNIERPASAPRIPSITRACVLNWLLKVNGSDGNPAVIQTASWYLDSVLSISSVRLDQLQLVATACYWIAQKLHGPVAPASRLIKYTNRAFSTTQLLETEKAILNKLEFPSQPVVPQDYITYLSHYMEFPSQPVVPQDYITYLSWWSDNARPGEIEVAATFLCLCGLMVDKTLCSELPSVIAAACVRNALLLLGKRDLMLRLETCPVFQAAENKTTNMCCICSTLRRAVRLVSDNTYEYKAPIEIFGIGPHFIAQKVVQFANDLAILEVKCSSRN